jgi:hypothetical protein
MDTSPNAGPGVTSIAALERKIHALTVRAEQTELILRELRILYTLTLATLGLATGTFLMVILMALVSV